MPRHCTGRIAGNYHMAINNSSSPPRYQRQRTRLGSICPSVARHIQANPRELRELRALKITPIHKHLFTYLATYLRIDVKIVSDFVSESDTQIEKLENFCSANGEQVLVFYYQQSEEANAVPTGRPSSSRISKGDLGTERLFITDCHGTIPLKGMCLYFVKRRKENDITLTNAVEEISFGTLDSSRGLLVGLTHVTKTVFRPALAAAQHWDGEGSNIHINCMEGKQSLIEEIDSFLDYLDKAHASMEGTIKLEGRVNLNLTKVMTPAHCAEIAGSPEKLAIVEDLVDSWCIQIEQILATCRRMRRENDYSSPMCELEHWRRLTASFNFIVDQIKGHDCKMAINILNIAKSRVLRKWQAVDRRITEAGNEAKDNVKYLYTLDRFCEPLYKSDPKIIAKGLPSLVHAINMIQRNSRFYHTSERMASLFIKVTNQIVESCKDFLKGEANVSVWDQPIHENLEKIKACTDLYNHYQTCVQEAKQKTTDFHGSSVGFSERNIFGKFELFGKRLRKLKDMLEAAEIYTALTDCSIDGMEYFAHIFDAALKTFKKKQIDALDLRNAEFDLDYEDFQMQFQITKDQIQDYVDKSISTAPNSLTALSFLQRFRRLNIPSIEFEEKYVNCFQQYAREVNDISQRYEKFKDAVPTLRDMPPIAGRITWARKLYLKIREPMNIFAEMESLIKSSLGKRVVKQFNKTASALLEYEVLYHLAWANSLENIEDALNAHILVRNVDTGDLFVNFDPSLHETMRESDVMLKMGLELPEVAKILHYNRNKYKTYVHKLELILKTYSDTVDKIPRSMLRLMKNSVEKVENIILSGVFYYTWSSINLDVFFLQADYHLTDLKELVRVVSNLKATYIDESFAFISEYLVCELPKDKPWTIEEFVKQVKKNTEKCSRAFDNRSRKVEDAANTLLRIFLKKAGVSIESNEDCLIKLSSTELDGSKSVLRREGIDFFYSLQQKNGEVILKAIKNSLEYFRRRLLFAATGRQLDDHYAQLCKPVFETDVVIDLPHVSMVPSAEEVQAVVSKAAKTIIETTKGVGMWKQLTQITSKTGDITDDSMSKSTVVNEGQTSWEQRNAKNYYKGVVENKDIGKLLQILSSSVNIYRDKVNKILKTFEIYNYLLTREKSEEIRVFMKSQPIQYDFEQKLQELDKTREEISKMPSTFIIGPFCMKTNNLKYALTTEIKQWKLAYVKALHSMYQPLVTDITKFADDQMKILSKPVQNLDDVRTVMKSLERVRGWQTDIDLKIRPIEDAYTMVTHFDIQICNEEVHKVDGLRYAVAKIVDQANNAQNVLVTLQPVLREQLIKSVEDFSKRVDEYEENYATMGPMAEAIDPQDASDRLNVFQHRFDELYQRYEANATGEELFGLQVTDYPTLTRIGKELQLQQKLYGLFNTVMRTVTNYHTVMWKEVNTEAMKEQLIEFQDRCRKLPKAVKHWQAFVELKQQIDDSAEICPLLDLMANNSLSQRHWDRLSAITGNKFDFESETFCLKDIMESNILKYKYHVEDTCISATKEHDIAIKLNLVIAEWSSQTLSFAAFKNRGEIIMKTDETSEVMAKLEDSLIILSSLKNNRYNLPFKESIQTWIQNLSMALDVLDEWMHVQNLWVYLEAIFIRGDIAKKLPQEAKRFSAIDSSWVKLMHRARQVKTVINCCVFDTTLYEHLPHMRENLEICQKSLAGYLEIKRTLFPRFSFVSDSVLLEILGHGNNPKDIQQHLCSVFTNVAFVIFHNKEADNITAVVSQEGEELTLQSGNVVAKGNVEAWLADLLTKQQRALHRVIKNAHKYISNEAGFDLPLFLQDFPSQVGILGLQFIWTRDAENAIHSSKTDKKSMSLANQKFNNVLNAIVKITSTVITSFEQKKLEAVITIHVHQRDIFESLVKLNVRSVTDFEWLKQIRFYFKDDSDDCLIAITDVFFVYQNEFLGCCDRLVITPLTDRCYITIAQALKMSMGAAPAGPAGTGKTETVKDMGKALGMYVVVFNCSDQMDFRGLGRIFKGLAMSGTWGCFDEFNRILLPVLSVAAGQIHCIMLAKRESKTEFVFTDGCSKVMNPQFGVFITMNPGYAGRQELPENLKVLFRTIAMMVPDRQIIIRVKLASCGFQENQILSQKFFTLYKLCEEQLSLQVHYDFGLRNMLSVLRTLGTQKRAYPEETEKMIVMQVLRNMNLSKLIDDDEPLFLRLIEDLFPGSPMDSKRYPSLESSVQNRIEESNLINHPPWRMKVLQLYETSLVRHGIMVLGPSGAGKSCCISCLTKSLTDMGTPHKEIRMNPKSITASQMFGRLDVASNDWTDGIFSTLWRRCLKLKKADHSWWITLDGPVDAVWIENLNSVLDDNKTLTLANGDRLPMDPNSKVIFEVHNIDNASPATVSRNGMVFMSSSVLEWKPILQGWLKTRHQREYNVLLQFFDSIFESAYYYVVKSLKPKMEILQCNYIIQACNLLQGLMPREDDLHQTITSAIMLENIAVFSLMWSLGALLEPDDRARLQQFLLDKAESISLPQIKEGESIFEYFVNCDGKWKHWSSKVTELSWSGDSLPGVSSILVPNIDNVRTNFLLDAIAKQEKPVLLIGEPGTAKTVMIRSYMSYKDSRAYFSKGVNFSSATTPLVLQRIFEGSIEKRAGTTYGPPEGRKMIMFIDDINMPNINEWGDQETNELLRQVIEDKGFYNVEKPGEFTTIVDIQIMASMIHPGGGHNDIPQRLKRHFTVINCALPSEKSIERIFSVISRLYFTERRFNKNVCDIVKQLVPMTREIVQQTKASMLPTPKNFHYIFNLRDISRIWEGMVQIGPNECPSIDILIGLWKHECTRVLADRFSSELDRKWFKRTALSIAKKYLGEHCESHFKTDTYFVDFLRDPPEDEDENSPYESWRVYEHCDIPTISRRLMFCLTQFNENVRGANLDLVFFEDCVRHIVRISRILRIRRGSALLIGVGGCGKHSIVKLASYLADYPTFQIAVSRAYTFNNFKDDIKHVYRTAGIKGRGMTFLFSEQDAKDDSFLELLNTILGSGEITTLFTKDELETIFDNLGQTVKKEKKSFSSEELYKYFIERARNNLHVVLTFSPTSDKLRKRALKFPSLISGCTIDWYHEWPRDALVSVCAQSLDSYEIDTTPQCKLKLVELMGDIHVDIRQEVRDYFDKYRRQTHVTPPLFLAFLRTYKIVYSAKHEKIAHRAQRMDTGLLKLTEASELVDNLSHELVEKEEELAASNIKADAVLKMVTSSAQAAEKVKQEVQIVKDKAQAIVDAISVEKAAAEEKLEAARPAVEAAEAALLTIKPAHVATVKKLQKPPHLIMRIMDCALLLLQKRLNKTEADPERPCPKPSWNESLKFMSSVGFMNTLLNFSKDCMNDEIVELMAPYTDMEDYTYENAKKVCGDVAGLLSWSLAMITYHSINKEVLPMKANLFIQENKLKQATSELGIAQKHLEVQEMKLAKARQVYDDAAKEKRSLINDAENCRRKMDIATKLIEGLGGEKRRWTKQSKECRDSISQLAGDAVIVSAFLSYAGPFNQEFRRLLQSKWEKRLEQLHIPFTPALNIAGSLMDKSKVVEWTSQGLPDDKHSVQNAIIVTEATRYPLIIDPQGQGKRWIKRRESSVNLITSSLNDKHFRNFLEDALSLGRPILLENVDDELDHALNNILRKNFIKIGTMNRVKIGDKECDVLPGFYLYLSTNLSNPSYSAETSAKTTIIDFTVTQQGLEEQLLSRVILTEKKDLESHRLNLLKDIAKNDKCVQDLEDNMLYKLSSTEGSLVEDESLIEVLSTTRKTAHDVHEKLVVAAETETKINDAREEFRPVAKRGSLLYFLICEMNTVNHMYQTSINQFLKLFDEALRLSRKSMVPVQRTHNIREYLTYSVYKYTCRGLYEKDKFLFQLLLALKIDMENFRISADQFDVLIHGGAGLDARVIPSKPLNWLANRTWLNIFRLAQLSGFEELINKLTANEKAWHIWAEKDAPENEILPENFDLYLDSFGKLLLIRSFCEDRTLTQARAYIENSLGSRYIDPGILDLQKTFDESSCTTPLMCLLSTGSDPSYYIQQLSKKTVLDYHAISLGQGQEILARKVMKKFMTDGGWILLQNCHLSLDFMEELHTTISEEPNINHNFRLWMTTEEHADFPIGLLQMSIRFTSEPPCGIKAGLKRTFAGITKDLLDYTNAPHWRPLLYAVSFFHSAIQERRKYGPLGWNVPYEFNSADWLASVTFLQNHVDETDPRKGVSWTTVRYMIGEVQYGGRVTDNYDKRLLMTIVKIWFGEHLLKDNFCFYEGYTIPKKMDIVARVLHFIDELPAKEAPGVFGLHSNADITHQTLATAEIMNKIIDIQPKDKPTETGESRESIVYQHAEDMLSKLPSLYEMNDVSERLKTMGNTQPLVIFLKQEIDRMQKLLKAVRNTLQDLRLAIDGTAIMDSVLRDTLDNVFNSRVPATWERLSWISSSIGFWFTTLVDRNVQYQTWLAKGKPSTFWLPGFFNPQGFLTAMRQEVTRSHKGWALDNVSLQNDVIRQAKEDIREEPMEGVYVHGLYIEGASWDRKNGRLTESLPKVIYTRLPVIHIYAVNGSPVRDGRTYACPLYKNRTRTDATFVTALTLRTRETTDKWIMRGVAALCSVF